MYPGNTPISSSLLRTASLLVMLAAGCGATSTQLPVGASKSPTTTPAATSPRGPQLGYLWDATQKNLFPLPGVAGATLYGAPLLPGGSVYVSGAVGGSRDAGAWALLLDKTGTVDLLTLPSATTGLGAPAVVATRLPSDATITFSPSGTYAVIFSASANAALLVSGLPSRPQVADLALPGALSGVAVSDRGTVLAGWSKGTSGGVVQVGALSGTGATAIASVATWGGAAFVPGLGSGQEQAIVADNGAGLLLRLTGIGGEAPTFAALATGGNLQTPVGAAVSGDGLWAFAADSAKQQVVRVDLSGSTPAIAIACACQPARLLALPGGMLFEVSADQPAKPAWLLDAHTLAPRTFFVPALPAPAASATAAGTTAVPAAGGAR
jgi:hypothetical protein